MRRALDKEIEKSLSLKQALLLKTTTLSAAEASNADFGKRLTAAEASNAELGEKLTAARLKALGDVIDQILALQPDFPIKDIPLLKVVLERRGSASGGAFLLTFPCMFFT